MTTETASRKLLVVGALLDRIPGDRDSVLILRRGVVTEQRVLEDEEVLDQP